MIIYISGKITGTTDYEQRFAEAEKEISILFPFAKIVNPVKLCSGLNPDISTWFDYMDKCIKELKYCTHIRMIDGWQESRGALVEYYLAKERLLLFV